MKPLTNKNNVIIDPNEIWIFIKGYEQMYQASNLGRVRTTKISYLDGSISSFRILLPIKQRTGYCSHTLCKNGIKTPILLHRIIATTFIKNPENKPAVNHINGVKDDNRVDNLEWVDYSENMKHSIAIGLRKSNSGRRNPLTRIYKDTKSKKDFTISELAVKLGVSKSAIYRRMKNNPKYYNRYIPT